MSSSVCRAALAAVVLAAAGCNGSKSVEVLDWYVTRGTIPTYQGVYTPDEGAGDGSPKAFVVFRAQYPVDQLWVEQPKQGTKYRWLANDFKVITADGQEYVGKFSEANGKFGVGGVFLDEPAAANSRIGVAFVVDEKSAQAGPIKVKLRDLPEFELPADKKIDPPTAEPSAPGKQGASPKGPPMPRMVPKKEEPAKE
jgi:hypothetical protein